MDSCALTVAASAYVTEEHPENDESHFCKIRQGSHSKTATLFRTFSHSSDTRYHSPGLTQFNSAFRLLNVRIHVFINHIHKIAKRPKHIRQIPRLCRIAHCNEILQEGASFLSGRNQGHTNRLVKNSFNTNI